jgi:hypothetical protein
MNRLKGQATLTFDDGDVFHGDADLVPLPEGKKGFTGIFKSPDIFLITSKESHPKLKVNGVRFEVHVRQAGSGGYLNIETSGGPIA